MGVSGSSGSHSGRGRRVCVCGLRLRIFYLERVSAKCLHTFGWDVLTESYFQFYEFSNPQSLLKTLKVAFRKWQVLKQMLSLCKVTISLTSHTHTLVPGTVSNKRCVGPWEGEEDQSAVLKVYTLVLLVEGADPTQQWPWECHTVHRHPVATVWTPPGWLAAPKEPRVGPSRAGLQPEPACFSHLCVPLPLRCP